MSPKLIDLITQPTMALFEEAFEEYFNTNVKEIRKCKNEEGRAYDPTNSTDQS